MRERQAYALDQLVREVNDHAPTRSKASDGGRASPEHTKQNPNSDHEPNSRGVWRAYDFTNDPTHGLSSHALALLLVGEFGQHPAMMSGAYVISNGKIMSYDRRREGWRPYTGSNPHTGHCHLSVSTSAAGYDSRKPWNLWTKPTRVTRARELLELAAKHSGPIRRRAILAALKLLPKR